MRRARLPRPLRRIACLPDWSVELTGGGHWRLQGPGVLYFMAATPSDRRSLRNTLSDLRRAGAPDEVLEALRAG